VKVASSRRTSGTDQADDVPGFNYLPFAHGARLQVVVRSDQPVAVIDLYPVASAPGMPAHLAHVAVIGRMNGCATGRGEVLPGMKFSRGTCDRIRA
jgi:hypothetical protein